MLLVIVFWMVLLGLLSEAVVCSLYRIKQINMLVLLRTKIFNIGGKRYRGKTNELSKNNFDSDLEALVYLDKTKVCSLVLFS